MEILSHKQVKGKLLDETEKEVLFITEEKLNERTGEVESMWNDLLKKIGEYDEIRLWNLYHEAYHSNEGNILFEAKKSMKDEDGVYVRITSARLYPHIQNNALNYKYAISDYGEMQDEDGNFEEFLEDTTIGKFDMNEMNDMINFFIETVNGE